VKDVEKPATGPIAKGAPLRQKSLALEMIEGAVARLKELETLRGRSSPDAVLTLRQMLIQFEKRGLMFNGDFDKCMDVIKVLEWD